MPTWESSDRGQRAAEAGPAVYLAKLFGSGDTEAVVRLITALLVICASPGGANDNLALLLRDGR